MKKNFKRFYALLLVGFMFFIGMGVANAASLTLPLNDKIKLPAHIGKDEVKIDTGDIDVTKFEYQTQTVGKYTYEDYVAAYNDYTTYVSTEEPKLKALKDAYDADPTDPVKKQAYEDAKAKYDSEVTVKVERLNEVFAVVCDENWTTSDKIVIGKENETCTDLYQIIAVRVTDSDGNVHYNVLYEVLKPTNEICEDKEEPKDPDKIPGDSEDPKNPENPKTGISTPYVIGLGIGAIGVITLVINKKKKFL